MPKKDKKSESEKMTQKCTQLSSVPTWLEYFMNNRSRLEKQLDADFRGNFPVEKSEEDRIFNEKVSLWLGDITTLEVDAIVNSANPSLLAGGVVCSDIHRVAGPALVQECKLLDGCSIGEAKITGGHNLPAKYVIHTAGPRGEKPELLESCYKKCLEIAANEKLRTIAFPCISAGLYGYPQDAAALVAIEAIRSFLEKGGSDINRIIFCLFLPTDVRIYENLLQLFFPVE